MSLRKKIICGILAVVVVGIGAVAIWLRDDINAVLSGLRYSSDELEVQLTQNEQAIKDATQVAPDITIRDLTEEDRQSLKDGSITKEELIQSLIEPVQQPKQETKQDGQQPTKQDEQPSAPSQKDPVQVSDYQKQLASIIAEVYVLREEFLIELDDLLAEAKAEYVSIPKNERTTAKLTSLASGYFTRAYSLEKECDGLMKDIIDRLEELLQANGDDLSIADAVYDTYLSEKRLKKSWYLAELKKRGI
ncbi:MAG: hypothetical protein IJB75_05805 [Oscillospiraceae bacterium]|nr:hypothetical protein [Oscillospiraceae bacterium]